MTAIASIELKTSQAAIFRSKHNLPFLAAPYPSPIDDGNNWSLFKIGTCDGLWTSKENSYDILVVTNSNPGNGHFEDVLEWFEQSCRRDQKALRILEIWNSQFFNHLISKRGFKRELLKIGEPYAVNVKKEW